MAATWHDFGPFPLDEIERVVAKNGGIFHSFGSGFSCPGTVDSGANPDWKVLLCDTQGMGNHGSIIAVAMTPAAYRFQLAHTLRILRERVEKSPPDERGNFAIAVVPLLASPLAPGNAREFGRDEKYRYFAYEHANFVRVGNGQHRLWVRPLETSITDLESTHAPR